MTFSASVLRLATLLVTFVFAAGVWSSTAQAQPAYSLTGNARFQIGNGLPIPVGFTPAPNGAVLATSKAFVVQTPGPDPQVMKIKPGAFTIAPTPPRNIGLFPQNNALFQVQTGVGLSVPGASRFTTAGPGTKWVTFGGTLSAGGRTGASTVTFCAGSVVTPTGNPGCTNPNNGVINGLMRYTKTVAQFGGQANGSVSGTANIAIRAGGTPPCAWTPATSCTAIFAIANPSTVGAQGAPFGLYNSSAGAAPNPGVALVNANAQGTITTVVATLPYAGLPNPATSYGGPWTTGMITITVNAASPPETFVLSGSDARVGGQGSISLVNATIANRGVSGPNANRGWLNMVVGHRNIPAVSAPGLAAAFGLLALAGGYALRRWVR